MPIYTYRCQSCEGVFETFHLMSETLSICSLCEQVDTIEKIPSMLVGKLTTPVAKAKVGDVVENFTLLDQHGEMVDLYSFCGQTVSLVFGAFW